MIKFATVENGEIVLYTKQENCTFFRKPIFDGSAKRITSKQFEEACAEAKKHKDSYFYFYR